MTHPLLLRQLKKLGVGDVSALTPAMIEKLLETVSNTYYISDEDRHRLERSLDVSSSEMIAVNAQLKGETARLQIFNEEIERSRIKAVGQTRKLRKQSLDLALARDVALQSVKAKSLFLANMSHEIRTPMNGVIGMTSLLMETSMTPAQREYLDTIRASGESMLSLIDDILDLAKIESGKMEIQAVPFCPRGLIEEVASIVAPRAFEKKIDIVVYVEPDIGSSLVGDPVRIRQILVNLLGNAVKFTEKGFVVIRARRVGTGVSAKLAVTVGDTGLGIDKSRKNEIFESFTQADGSTTRRFGGTGLGLTICKQLVNLMGGRLKVVSEPNRGSAFSVSIPVQFVQPGPNPEKDSLRAHRVGVMVQSKYLHLSLVKHLNYWGCTPVSGFSEEPEAIITDGHSASRLLTLGIPLVVLVKPGETFPSCAQVSQPVRAIALLATLQNVLGSPEKVVIGKPVSLPDPSFAGMRVLLVEDNLVNQKVATGMLRRLDIEVEIACNGLDAISRMYGRIYDLILMDCQMPILDGFETTRRIRQLPAAQGGKTPIVALTAHSLDGDRSLCLSAGMNDYLTKPIRKERLIETLGHWLPQASLSAA